MLIVFLSIFNGFCINSTKENARKGTLRAFSNQAVSVFTPFQASIVFN